MEEAPNPPQKKTEKQPMGEPTHPGRVQDQASRLALGRADTQDFSWEGGGGASLMYLEGGGSQARKERQPRLCREQPLCWRGLLFILFLSCPGGLFSFIMRGGGGRKIITRTD